MDVNKVYLSQNIKKVLSKTEEKAGYVAGWSLDSAKICAAVAGCREYFLTGLEVNGIFCILHSILPSENELIDICEKQCEKLEIGIENLIVIFGVKDEQKELEITVKYYSTYCSTLKDIDVESCDPTSALLLRARGIIPCYFEVSSDEDLLRESIDQALERVKSVFQKEVAAFFLQNGEIIRSSSTDQTSDDGLTIKKLLKSVQEDDTSGKSKIKKASKKKLPTEFNILIQAGGDGIANTFNHSVVIHCQQREFQCASVQLPIDVLIVCQESSSTQDAYKLFLEAIGNQLSDMNNCLVKYTKISDIEAPKPYHFYLDMWDFPITVVYPAKKSDEELETYRKELHRKLLLPMDRPFLKKLNACDFSLASSSGHLYNPHEGIVSSGVSGGKSSIVQGTYSYHHYMQDHMDDNGWGCAYRSLQTIISWFRHQGYTDRNVPTHTEIQKALVEVGDKPESFIGSKKWIGSQEVSFCLDHLINVQSKIMFVSSGADMANKGRELYNHFQDQGTPVMIGGGVLAHTILGVDFNQDTGELKFLILDPHYTGKEDLNIILSKIHILELYRGGYN
ncbi:ufm1-specific protease 2 isoform X2 [Parasteatoda tepidariorum]|uniref:ufm1-specific protease 2 isoform X2 n=1 Tax=Parasteatoda tepidariorum TaxID=114398 RepID=UPI0039BC35DA